MPSGEVDEDDARGIADRGVMAGEPQRARRAIHPEDGDVVSALIAAIEELPRGVEVEAAGIIAVGPLLADVRQAAARPDREDPDAVVEPVARVDEAPIRRDQDLRAEVAAGEAGRQGGDRLPGLQVSRL